MILFLARMPNPAWAAIAPSGSGGVIVSRLNGEYEELSLDGRKRTIHVKRVTGPSTLFSYKNSYFLLTPNEMLKVNQYGKRLDFKATADTSSFKNLPESSSLGYVYCSKAFISRLGFIAGDHLQLIPGKLDASNDGLAQLSGRLFDLKRRHFLNYKIQEGEKFLGRSNDLFYFRNKLSDLILRDSHAQLIGRRRLPETRLFSCPSGNGLLLCYLKGSAKGVVDWEIENLAGVKVISRKSIFLDNFHEPCVIGTRHGPKVVAYFGGSTHIFSFYIPSGKQSSRTIPFEVVGIARFMCSVGDDLYLSDWSGTVHVVPTGWGLDQGVETHS